MSDLTEVQLYETEPVPDAIWMPKNDMLDNSDT